mmetsp:Transcript_32240/g.80288  ORF Transcript_32240/g.80288 Transcript_32240/m.80288 type:complete len:271 (-) Transcript_32240:2141-2953(-)
MNACAGRRGCRPLRPRLPAPNPPPLGLRAEVHPARSSDQRRVGTSSSSSYLEKAASCAAVSAVAVLPSEASTTTNSSRALPSTTPGSLSRPSRSEARSSIRAARRCASMPAPARCSQTCCASLLRTSGLSPDEGAGRGGGLPAWLPAACCAEERAGGSAASPSRPSSKVAKMAATPRSISSSSSSFTSSWRIMPHAPRGSSTRAAGPERSSSSSTRTAMSRTSASAARAVSSSSSDCSGLPRASSTSFAAMVTASSSSPLGALSPSVAAL